MRDDNKALMRKRFSFPLLSTLEERRRKKRAITLKSI